jgi:hypothetical protein
VAFAPLTRPQVKSVMQINVGEDGRDHRTLRRPNLGFGQHSVFHHAGFEPFAYQPDYPPVADPVLYETYQPFMIDRVVGRGFIIPPGSCSVIEEAGLLG